MSTTTLTARQLHVSKNGSDNYEGNKAHPFLTISKAAHTAIAGDTVMIHGGVYREWVSPQNSGFSARKPIVYMAASSEKVYLKGSEEIKSWKSHKKNVWKAEIDNVLFGDFNPFSTPINGDWIHNFHEDRTLGAVYLNNNRLTGVVSLEEVYDTPQTWYAKVEADKTIIYANFGENNPKKGLVEVNARPACFFPKNTGVNYITLDGLNISQASPQWAPPTAPQMGMVGPHWSKGWVIRNCEISHSRCSGISLGKDNASGNNLMSIYNSQKGFVKDGFTRENEAILSAYAHGWNKDQIGSHLIENNFIHHCGQTGIVGHLGGVGSIIRNNRIHHINVEADDPKGYETGGIKLHASIDVIIDHNYISKTRRGIWLDWQAQGTHVCNNIIRESLSQDLFMEVSHGPTLIYNNLFLSSSQNLLLDAQGVAIFNNLFYGANSTRQSQIRYTPYHLPHSTTIKGLYNNPGGDVRLYNNIFLCKNKTYKKGLLDYNKFPTLEMTQDTIIRETHNCLKYLFPIWTSANVYAEEDVNYKHEKNYTILSGTNFEIILTESNRRLDVEFKADISDLKKVKTCTINTEMLGESMISEAYFEYPDGTPFVLEKDMSGMDRNVNKPLPGPMENLKTTFTW